MALSFISNTYTVGCTQRKITRSFGMLWCKYSLGHSMTLVHGKVLEKAERNSLHFLKAPTYTTHKFKYDIAAFTLRNRWLHCNCLSSFGWNVGTECSHNILIFLIWSVLLKW
jgi:hypothetical protein